MMSRRRRELCRGKQRVRIRADRVEGGVAEVEQAGEADHDVQPDREQHERPGTRCLRDEGGAVCRIDGGHGKDEGEDEQDAVDGRIPVADSIPQVEARENRRAHFSGTRMPSRPVGLKTRTPIRMPKTTTCVHFDPM